MALPVSGDEALDRKIARGGNVLDASVRLYFAGEATHIQDSYTVHGAYMSGKREAKKIMAYWREFGRNIVQNRKNSNKVA